MTNMIVFWKYDVFPYALYATVVDADVDTVKVKGYGGMRVSRKNILAILPEPMAETTIVELDRLEKAKRGSDEAFKAEAEAVFSQSPQEAV